MTFTAVSIVMSTLLASPRAEALVPSFAGRGVSMVSALIPLQGRAANTIPSTPGGTPTGPARVFDDSRGQPKRSPTGTAAAAAPPSGDADDARQDEHHPASAVYFADDDALASQLPGSLDDQRDLSTGPPEPGGGGVDRRHRAQQLVSSSQRNGALPAVYHRPWRQRAREARRQTVFENNPEDGFEAEEGGGGSLVGARRKRASEKEEVVASRRDSQQKAINRAALPIVDLVGLVSPLVLIAGMTVVHIVP